MYKVIAGVVLATALACASAATAGGWATVSMSSHPSTAEAGKPWTVDLTVLQHGLTPLAGVRPFFRIKDVKADEVHVFSAEPTSRAGVYRATVVFPSAGRWPYEIDDGFSQVHTYAPVTIGSEAAPVADEKTAHAAAPAPASEGGSLPPLAILAAVGLAVLVGAGAGAALAHRQRTSGARP